MKFIVWVREKGDHSGDEVMMQFDTEEERYQYMKAMRGVLISTDSYITNDKHPEKCHTK